MLGIDSPIREEVTRARLRLFGHVVRMDDQRLPKVLVEDCFEPNHSTAGRPRKSWGQCLVTDMKSRGFGPHSGARLAVKNRKTYRSIIVYNMK